MHLAQKQVLAFAALASMSAAVAQAQSEGVAWRTDIASAQAEAQQTGKLVLAHFWTESCGPCKALEARVFSQPSVGLAINDRYVPVKINANEHPELARQYGVTRVPTDAVVTARGELVKSFVSPATPMDYVGYVTRLAGAYQAQAGGQYAAAAANAPDTSGYRGNSVTKTNAGAEFNQAYANLIGQSTPPTAPPANPVAANPYATNPPSQPAPPAPAVVKNDAYAPVTPEVPATPAKKPTAETVADASPQLPPGSPPLGFEGFCPVTMKSDWRWSKGDVRFGAIHRGRTYLFATSEAQKAFLADPDTYSPVLAGSDPVAAVDERRSVPGEREYAVEYEGRFYLFANEKTLEKFWTDPTAYAKGVERVAALPPSESFIR
ncbi:MAG: DUF255 domain-containing protein [Planctomycetota bacterium]